MNDNPRSYSTLQLAQTLGVSVQTVQRWVDAGHVKAWKTVGGHRKIDADSADAWIRRMRATGEDAEEAKAISTPHVSLRALLVDDDAAFLEVLETLVADHIPGAAIEKANNGFQALQSMARTTPDLLVTDVVMPHIDGLEMLRHVSAQATRPACVVVTSVLAREDVERKGALPADIHFFAKPLDQDAFATLLRSQARQASLRR
jgi:excisionase family DNA binding protein